MQLAGIKFGGRSPSFSNPLLSLNSFSIVRMDADQESTDDETLVKGLHVLIADNTLDFEDNEGPSHEAVKAAHNADLSALEQLPSSYG